jgi:hypothetical protein
MDYNTVYNITTFQERENQVYSEDEEDIHRFFCKKI